MMIIKLYTLYCAKDKDRLFECRSVKATLKYGRENKTKTHNFNFILKHSSKKLSPITSVDSSQEMRLMSTYNILTREYIIERYQRIYL